MGIVQQVLTVYSKDLHVLRDLDLVEFISMLLLVPLVRHNHQNIHIGSETPPQDKAAP